MVKKYRTVQKLHHWVVVTFVTQCKMWSSCFLQTCHKVFSYRINLPPLNRADLHNLQKGPIREDIWCKFISSLVSTKPLILWLKRLKDVFLLRKKIFRKRKNNWKMHWRALNAHFLPLEKERTSKAIEYFTLKFLYVYSLFSRDHTSETSIWFVGFPSRRIKRVWFGSVSVWKPHFLCF